MHFFLYCLCGGIGVFIDSIFYLICISFDFSYQSANACGYFLGTCTSFILNRKLTFQVSDQILKRFFVFLGVAMLGFFVSAFMLWLMVAFFNIGEEIAKFFTLPFVVGVQYFLNKRITFVAR